jgi:hypothetical protein
VDGSLPSQETEHTAAASGWGVENIRATTVRTARFMRYLLVTY